MKWLIILCPVIASSVGSANAQQSNTLSVGEALPEDDQIYEDPGHVKEEIYEWLKKRNVDKIDKNT